MRHFLQRVNHNLTLRRLLIIFAVYHIAVVCVAVRKYEWNPSAMIHFGSYYVQQNARFVPRGAVRYTGNEEYGGNGYDGQIFFFFASTLLERGIWPQGFNNAYRAPRVGYPMLVAPFSLLGAWGTVAGMILVQIALLGAATAAMFRMLPSDKRWLSLLYLASPFHLQAFSVLVSDSVVSSLLVLGMFCLRRRAEGFPFSGDGDGFARRTIPIGGRLIWISGKTTGRERIGFIAAWICFSLAVLTKESSLFLLFPLGLAALVRRDAGRSAAVALTLVPAILWQYYLRKAHGMVPAEILGTFVSPLDGIRSVISTAVQMLRDGKLGALAKHSAKLLLLVVLGGTYVIGLTRLRGNALPYAFATLLAALSITVADYYYFWGIFENVGRMFTLIVPMAILLAAQMRPGIYPCGFGIFAASILLLSALVWLRLGVLSPAFPHDHWEPYQGPSHAGHAPALHMGN